MDFYFPLTMPAVTVPILVAAVPPPVMPGIILAAMAAAVMVPIILATVASTVMPGVILAAMAAAVTVPVVFPTMAAAVPMVVVLEPSNFTIAAIAAAMARPAFFRPGFTAGSDGQQCRCQQDQPDLIHIHPLAQKRCCTGRRRDITILVNYSWFRKKTNRRQRRTGCVPVGAGLF